MMNILEELEAETEGDFILDRTNEEAVIMGKTHKVTDLKYVIEQSGREYVALRSILPLRKIILFLVKE